MPKTPSIEAFDLSLPSGLLRLASASRAFNVHGEEHDVFLEVLLTRDCWALGLSC